MIGPVYHLYCLRIIQAEKEWIGMDFSGVGQILLRMVTIFMIALIVVRVMGNRTVGQFSPFDFVLMVGIGDIVGNVALDRNYSILVGVEALFGLFILQQALSWSSLKSAKMRKWFEGSPVVLIDNGRIVTENLVKTQFNLDDLRQELHKQGLDFTNLRDIKMARLESSGDFSVIMAPEMEPLTRRDFNQFIQSMTENPLSPSGMTANKLEQLFADMQLVVEYVKQHQAGAGLTPKEEQGAAEKLH